MTEAEWLKSDEPYSMLRFLRGKVSDRKVRLFAVACCRRLLFLATDERNKTVVEVAERFADGHADIQELLAGRGTIGSSDISVVLAHVASMMVWHAAEWAMKGAKLATEPEGEEATQSNLCRDIFGNPFRPVAVDAAWLTSDVLALARQMYESRDFSAMPILADALQDAGCDNPDVLNHCREGGPHVRGCWVVDLLLGKE